MCYDVRVNFCGVEFIWVERRIKSRRGYSTYTDLIFMLVRLPEYNVGTEGEYWCGNTKVSTYEGITWLRDERIC